MGERKRMTGKKGRAARERGKGGGGRRGVARHLQGNSSVA
jgi:hypothetical protein